VTEEDPPVALEESSPMSSNDKEPNGESKKPPRRDDGPPDVDSAAEKEGEASPEVLSLNGGCDKPIETAIQFITSCRRSKSTPSKWRNSGVSYNSRRGGCGMLKLLPRGL
jgi:hypothetical protein